MSPLLHSLVAGGIAMGRAWYYLERLTRQLHRGSGTAAEMAAANRLRDWLRGMGYTVVLQPFQTPRDTLYMGPFMVMVLHLVAFLLARHHPVWALLLCGGAIAPLNGELVGSDRLDLDWLLRRHPSQNVVAQTNPSLASDRTIVVSAHYDSQRASLLFHPQFVRFLQPYFMLVYTALVTIPIGIALVWGLPGRLWPSWLLSVAALILGGSALLLLYCRLTGYHNNGANDNGSGVAVLLSLAERLAHRRHHRTRLIFLCTGAEEVGMRGMKAFVRRMRLDPATTTFINLDNLGAGTLHYLVGEGMLIYHRYSTALIDRIVALARGGQRPVNARRNLLLPTDGLVPARAGYQTITLIAFDDAGQLPHYHWHTDTLVHVEPAFLKFVESFVFDLVSGLEASLPG
jgi:hypothetical protein